jgi:single-strand DNA-binding protein
MQKFYCAPPEMQALDLGAAPTRFSVPQLQGQKMENQMFENRVHLIGYLGKSPEHKSTKTGRKFAVLSLATQSAWKDANEEWQRKVEWHRLIAWNGLGEYAANKLKKGDHLYVEGTLVSSTYEKEVGKGKSKTTVKITNWQIKAESIRKLNRAKGSAPAPSTSVEPAPSDIPF